MKKEYYAFILVLILNFSDLQLQAETTYYIPTHYGGLFYGQPTNARATAMGLTTITLGGIENVIYNPASIGLEQQKLNTYFNYAVGNQVQVGSSYRYFGASYRVNDKLVLGFSRFRWVEKDSPWTTIIGGYEESTDKSSQVMHSISGAYEVIPDLQLGLSGNFLTDRAVNDIKTNSSFILSLGAIYDIDVDWIKLENLENQKFRVAGSFTNLLLKNRIEQRYEDYLNYRDLPIQLTLGTSYQGTLPFNPAFLSKGNGFFSNAPKVVDLSLNLQFQEVLKGPEETVVNTNYKENTALGIGGEALFMKLLALRLGYYFEKRPKGFQEDGDFWVTKNKTGLTFGYGVKIPLNELTDKKVPFDVDVDIVTFRVLNELNTENYTHRPVFTDSKLLFSFGLKLKWIID